MGRLARGHTNGYLKPAVPARHTPSTHSSRDEETGVKNKKNRRRKKEIGRKREKREGKSKRKSRGKGSISISRSCSHRGRIRRRRVGGRKVGGERNAGTCLQEV